MKATIVISTLLSLMQPLSQAQPQTAATTQNSSQVSTASQMQTIGIIGGITWLSSAEYYKMINQMVQAQFGGVSSAKILMYSIEFEEFSRQERLALSGDFAQLNQTMLTAASSLKAGGADFVVIASNTMNSAADLIEKEVDIPVVRMPEVVGKAIKGANIHKVVLLGTKFTMEAPYYQSFLRDNFGIEAVVPEPADRDFINNVIFDELAAEKFLPESRQRFIQITNDLLRQSGAEGVILGCTEIPLLISQADFNVPVFNTTEIHSRAAVHRALR